VIGGGAPVYPDRDPDEYQPRHGSFTEAPVPPAQPAGSIGDRLGLGAPPPYDGDDATEIQYLPDGFEKFAPRDPDGPDDDYGYGDDPYDTGSRAGMAGPPAAPAKQGGRTAVRTLGEVLVTAGMVVLLFVVYELYVTNIFSAQKQASATTSLNNEWDTVGGGPQRTNHYDLADGHGIAKLYIPAFGQDYKFTVVEGTTQDDLAIGPGHYVGSALPGQPGDFAVAGHRVGEGAPFDDLGLVQSCDAVLIETQTDWYVYRMLPLATEAATWATGKGKTAQCSGTDGEAKVQPLGGLYKQTVGREIVLPSEGDVVATIPHHYGVSVPTAQQASLLTLTTCNPKFSAAQRMILHAVLVKDYHKSASDPDKMPPEMKETS
jgi:sortase (surface protein transpeptidase)